MVKYYSLLFQRAQEGEYKYWKKPDVQDRINWDFLGVDSYDNGTDSGDLEIIWFRNRKGREDPGFIDSFFDSASGTQIKTPISKEVNKILFHKYRSFLLDLCSLNQVGVCNKLFNLEQDFNLDIHVKPDIMKDEIYIETYYNGIKDILTIDSNYQKKKN